MTAVKRTLRTAWLSVLFLPGLAFIGLGLVAAARHRTVIASPVLASGRVERVYQRTERDLDGHVTRDRLRVSFRPRTGASVTVDEEVFSAAFLVPGDAVEVRYDPADPTRACVVAAFPAWPYHVVFLLLFGALWMGIALVVLALALQAWRRARGGGRA